MSDFTPADLERLAAGCTACGQKKLAFRMFVDARLPLMEGEPVGPLAWAYDGEAFCDGVFEVACTGCNAKLFASSACPRCHREGGLAVALASESAMAAPKVCARCGRQEITLVAMVPARTTYEGKRAEKARTSTELGDAGFHAYAASCKACGTFAELGDRCMLCDAPGPLRPRA